MAKGLLCQFCNRRFPHRKGLIKHLLEAEPRAAQAAFLLDEAKAQLSECYSCGEKGTLTSVVWGGGDSTVALLVYYTLCEECYQAGSHPGVEEELRENMSVRTEELEE